MKAARSSETLVSYYIYHTVLKLRKRSLNLHRCVNLKAGIVETLRVCLFCTIDLFRVDPKEP